MGSAGYALLLTLVAGLSTGIGSAIAYFFKKPRKDILSFALGLSAGVMIYVSFVELLPMGWEPLGEWNTVLIFFAGIFFIGIIDWLIPEVENPHHPVFDAEERQEIKANREDRIKNQNSSEIGEKNSLKNGQKTDKHLLRAGLLTALAIGIHNFPEGIATFGAALSDQSLGLMITIAIAIHNIPEGISVSMPIFHATGSQKKAFFYSFLSGVAEPIGALIAFLFISLFMPGELVAGLLVFVAGIMVYISLDEILPTAHHYGKGHHVIIGLLLGMGIMAVSLLLL